MAAGELLTSYEATDQTHRQIHPDALAIVLKHGGKVPKGVRDDGSPNFRGLPQSFWQKLYIEERDDFMKLYDILRTDFPTYCALMLKVVSRLDNNTHPFIWNEGQAITWDHCCWLIQNEKMIYIIILKARQLGMTTFVSAWHHWHLWRGQDVRCLDVTHDRPLAERVVGFFRVFHENLPELKDEYGKETFLLKPRLRSDTQHARIPRSEIYYADSRCQGDTYVAKNMEPRGFTTRFIGEHEAAFYPDLFGFNDALLPQLPAKGSTARLKCSIFVESTPQGQNDFYDLCMTAMEPESEPHFLFLPWYISGEYRMKCPHGWQMTDWLRELQEEWSRERMKIDGREVDKEQMYWWLRTYEDEYGSDRDAMDSEYCSDVNTAFMLKSHSAFEKEMRYLTTCVSDAEVRAAKAWKKFSVGGKPVLTKGAVCGKLEYEPLGSPWRSLNFRSIVKPKFNIGASSNLWIWEPPERNHFYVIGTDTRGGGNGERKRDESVCQVIDVTVGRQVAELAGPINPEEQADICVHLATWYNRAMVMPELNGLGSVVMKRMNNEWGYMNFAHEERWDEMGVKKNKPGWWMKDENRPYVFSTLHYFLREHFLEIASRRLLKQLSTFRQEGTDYRTAKKGQHDDLVTALGLACVAVRQSPKHFMQLEAARRNRLPNAVELGLNQFPEPQLHIRGERADEVLEKLKEAQKKPWDTLIAVNPMREVLSDYDWSA